MTRRGPSVGMRNLPQIELNRLRAQYNDLQRSCNYFRRRTEILEAILHFESPKLRLPGGPTAQEAFFREYLANLDHSCDVEASAVEFVDVLLDESQRNRFLHPAGRRWSQTVVVFCFLVRSLGAKAYECVRSVLTLPSKSTLLRRFSAPLQAWKECLLDFNKIYSICGLFRGIHALDFACDVEVVLGVDAMAMEPVLETNTEVSAGNNNVFLFYVMPLRCEFRSFPVHVMPRAKGNAGPDVIERLKSVKDKLREFGIVVKYVATDGDSGYKCLHDFMFSKWRPVYSSSGLDEVSKAIESCEFPIAGDLLHILKNARARLLAGPITLSLDGAFSFTADDMNKILQIGQSLTDKSSKGKMRDRYALEIFSLANFEKLVTQKEWTMAFFILPYALWAAAVRYPKLSTQMRRELLNFVFDLFIYHHKNIDDLDRANVSQNRSEHKVQYFCSKTQCVRAMNTLVVKLTELTTHPDNLAIGRIGTHGVECQFGIIRLLCHNKHSWKMIIRAFSKLMIIKDIGQIFGKVRPRERENISGVKIFNVGEDVIYKCVPVIEASHLYDCIHAAMMQQEKPKDASAVFLANEMASDLTSVTNYFLDFVRECKARVAEPMHLWREGAASNNGILARLISFRSATIPEESTERDSHHESSSTSFDHDHERVDGECPEFDTAFLPGTLICQQ